MNLAKSQDIELAHGVAFLYNNNEKSERGIKESIQFTIAIKRIKYLGINLPKETKKNCIQKIIRHWWKKSKVT